MQQQAIVVNEPSDASGLVPAEIPVPAPGPGQLLVKIAATGVNFIETYQRSGVYAVDYPFTPGTEFSGVVEQIGDGVQNYKIGDRVATASGSRGYAQYALVDAYTAIARSNGVNADLDTALAAADHGDTKSALRAAEAEWKRRETVHTADALAWALHVNGRDEEALPYARRATATGYRDATFLYHRGMVEYAAGDKKDARASLKAALDLNAGFSPLGAAEARRTLKALQALETAK